MDTQRSSAHPKPQTRPMTVQPVVKKSLQGIGGWLIFPIIGLLYMLYKIVMMLLAGILQVQTVWPLATQPDSDFYVPGFAMGFYLLQFAYGTLIVLFLWTLIAAVKGKRRAKWLFITTMVLFIVLLTVASFIFPSIFNMEIDYSNTTTIINGSFYCVLWVPYFLASQRVKNTFVH